MDCEDGGGRESSDEKRELMWVRVKVATREKKFWGLGKWSENERTR